MHKLVKALIALVCISIIHPSFAARETVSHSKPHINIGLLGHYNADRDGLLRAIATEIGKPVRSKTVVYEDAGDDISTGTGLIEMESFFTDVRANKKRYRFIHMPHGDMTKNIVTGTAPLDGAVVVVSASDGPMPQTREHVLLARQVGVPRMVVFMNILDQDLSTGALDRAEKNTYRMMLEAGYQEADFVFVRGYSAWYDGRDNDCNLSGGIDEDCDGTGEDNDCNLRGGIDNDCDGTGEDNDCNFRDNKDNDCDGTGKDNDCNRRGGGTGNDCDVDDYCDGRDNDCDGIPSLIQAVIDNTQLPPRDVDKDFLMPVSEVYFDNRKSALATGLIEAGIINTGEEVDVVGFYDMPISTSVGQIQSADRKILDRGEAGDNVGLLLRGIEKTDIRRGMVIAKPGTIKPVTRFKAEVYVLKKDEGGRHTPFHNKYRPQFYVRTTDVTGEIILEDGREMVMPGDNITLEAELIVPVAINKGLRFAIREGGRTVGAGQVTEIIK